MQRYIRLLSYDNAVKVVNFINKNNTKDNANITVGGVSTFVESIENWQQTIDFLISLNVPYEIGSEHPTTIMEQNAKTLKNEQ